MQFNFDHTVIETHKTIFTYYVYDPLDHYADLEEELIRCLQHLGLFDSINPALLKIDSNA